MMAVLDIQIGFEGIVITYIRNSSDKVDVSGNLTEDKRVRDAAKILKDER